MKNLFNRKICFDEYRDINGIEQYLMHCGTKYENPVMLFLHCSGLPESLLAYTFQRKWEEIYTVVHFDQRGIGKTFIKNPTSIPTAQKQVEDIHEIVKYLKVKYNKDKIVIFGHSWGTVIGTLYVQKYPEDVSYYIGASQAVNFEEGTHLAYERLKELAAESNDEKTLNELKKLGEDYPSIVDVSKYLKDAIKFDKIEQKYNLSENFMTISYFMQFFKSPIFRFSDITAMVKSGKVNMNLVEFAIKFNIKSLPINYKIPVYYISGENDWQTPHSLIKKYLNEINAPRKNLYIIPNAGHAVMFNNPDSCYEALKDIRDREEI